MSTKRLHLHLKEFAGKKSYRIEVENYAGHGHLQIYDGKELITEAHLVKGKEGRIEINFSPTLTNRNKFNIP